MRIPSFSRQSDPTTEDERPTVVSSGTAPIRERNDSPPPPAPASASSGRESTVGRPSTATTTEFPSQPSQPAQQPSRPAQQSSRPSQVDERSAANRDANVDLSKVKTSNDTHRQTDDEPVTEPIVSGPKPRASLLATFGLIFSVAGAMLVLSGPLTGYGIGVAGLALVLSLLGLRATRRRHVAGKTDAVLGTIISLAALVVGILAMTGSLSWAGTDVQPVNSLREWLDTQFGNRF